MTRQTSLLPKSAFATIGFWLGLLIGLSQAINAARAFVDPAGFALYMGLPIGELGDEPFVYVYGLRTAFIAILVFALAAMQRLDLLAWMALLAVFLPLGDAILAWQEGAATPTLVRHMFIAAYLLVSFFFLRRAVRAGIGGKL